MIASEPLSGPGAGAESWTLVHKDEMVPSPVYNSYAIFARGVEFVCMMIMYYIYLVRSRSAQRWLTGAAG